MVLFKHNKNTTALGPWLSLIRTFYSFQRAFHVQSVQYNPRSKITLNRVRCHQNKRLIHHGVWNVALCRRVPFQETKAAGNECPVHLHSTVMGPTAFLTVYWMKLHFHCSTLHLINVLAFVSLNYAQYDVSVRLLKLQSVFHSFSLLFSLL